MFVTWVGIVTMNRDTRKTWVGIVSGSDEIDLLVFSSLLLLLLVYFILFFCEDTPWIWIYLFWLRLRYTVQCLYKVFCSAVFFEQKSGFHVAFLILVF